MVIIGQGNEDAFTKLYRECRESLETVAPVSIAQVLAAKDDLLRIQKTSHQSIRGATQTFINNTVFVGKVKNHQYCGHHLVDLCLSITALYCDDVIPSRD